jgi:hypothetical protein
MSNPLMTVDLADVSLTSTEKNALISARILYVSQSQGVSLADAVDLVLGSGTVDALIDSVYRSIRAANGASVACGASEWQRQGD